MEIDRLIVDLLPSYSIIWDRTRKDFRDNNKKENAFKALAREINVTVETVMSRYKAIREKYRKEKQKMDTLSKSGSGTTEIDGWELYDSLTFLDVVMFPRKRTTNLLISKDGKLNNDNEQLQMHDIEERLDKTHSEITDVFMLSPGTPETTSLPSNSSGHDENKNKKRKLSLDEDLHGLVLSLKETATSLNNNKSIAEPSKYDWLGKYIASSLNAMEPRQAEEKSREVLAALLND
ncbi:hypothetical protein RN001_002070 [Aquatica leii]|uniref:MADF domain-containing protein n=1 Tax=Aquatica leii TaxID=1421715 RepID=A0AAN7Q4U7_9COLE|nr:hypothetical protein RN001_002070 [Aquatica leii]